MGAGGVQEGFSKQSLVPYAQNNAELKQKWVLLGGLLNNNRHISICIKGKCIHHLGTLARLPLLASHYILEHT